MPALKAKKKRWVLLLTLILLGVLVLTALDKRLQISRYGLRFENLPEGWNGTRIALVTDTHGAYMTGEENVLFSAVRAESPEYIFCLGDMLDESNPDFDAFTQALSVLTDIAPVYIVSGNHDRWTKLDGSFFSYYKQFCACCEQAGATLMDGKECFLTRNSDRIRLIGFADPEFWTADPEPGCMKEQTDALPGSDCFDVLLFHRANVFPEVAGKGYELVLSGHLHGGLVRIPGIGPLFRHLPVGDMTFAGGRYEQADTVLISGRGIGNNMNIPRVFNRPELVLITLEG